jgi:hypothetical protein
MADGVFGLDKGVTSRAGALHASQQELASRVCDDDASGPGVQTQGLSVEVDRVLLWTSAAVDANFHLHTKANTYQLSNVYIKRPLKKEQIRSTQRLIL